MTISYKQESDLTAEQFARILTRSTLAERRPNDLSRLQKMLDNANVVVTARDETGEIVGISRAISDSSYCTYLSDLAVDVDFQRMGIGKTLIRKTHEIAGLQTTLILLSAPAAVEYYPRIGMEKHDSCWIIRAEG